MIRRKIFLMTVFLFGVVLVLKAQIPSYVPTNGLMAWYPFNGNANDESGNGNNGTVNGATLTTDRKGNANTAYSFNGINNSINVSNSSSLNIQNYNGITISGWFNVNTLNKSLAMVNFTQGNGQNINYVFEYSVTGGLEFVNWNINKSMVYISMANQVTTNSWYHVLVTSDFLTNTSKFYVNGVLQGTSNTLLLKPISPNLNFGKHGGPLPWWLDGSLDDIGVWDRVLNQNEITALYQSCIDQTIYDTTSFYVSNNSFKTISPQIFYISTDSLKTQLGGCDSITHHYLKFIYDPTYCSVIDTLLIDVPLNVLNQSLTNTIKIYPNPTKDQIIIDFGNYIMMSDYTIKIINSLGQIVYISSTNQQLSNIDLSTWNKSLYFIQIIDNQNKIIENKKIVLQ